MSKVLYIKANSKPEGQSRTFKVSEAFIECYKKHHPDDEIITLDLYEENIDFLTAEGALMHVPTSPEEIEAHPFIKYAYQFLNADKYVFAEPMWNLGIPAILKAYLDYVCIKNVTFKYTADGPMGFCAGKPVINITTRGGNYAASPYAEMEMADRYLRAILGFVGVTDYTTLAVDKLDIIGVDVDALVREGIERAEELAKDF